jgi:predicted RNA-binding Zn ribbon-like protein
MAAPGELKVVEEFLNTLEVLTGRDRLAAWLAERELPDTPAELERAAAVREALRALLVANGGGELDPMAPAVLDEAAARAGLAVRFRADGSARVEPAAGGIDAELGRILAAVVAAMADGTWARLKACRAEDCRWAFYDHARNRTRSWCSMSVCGNREKARAYRRRRAAQ